MDKAGKTNYERITNMSPAELAQWILSGVSCDVCDYCNFDEYLCGGNDCRSLINEEIVEKWLMTKEEEEAEGAQ